MKKLPKKVISRVLLYIRTLEDLIKGKRFLVSSRELAEMTGVSDVQIRKDISNFGKAGTPRVGYNAKKLKSILEDFVVQKKEIKVAVFGVGNLGTAIMRYPGFRKGKLRIVLGFDIDRAKTGRTVNGVKVYHIEKAPEEIKKNKIDLGIIAVPAEVSQAVADLMVLSGLKGIINFSPVAISVPSEVSVKDMDLSIEFLSLYCETRM